MLHVAVGAQGVGGGAGCCMGMGEVCGVGLEPRRRSCGAVVVVRAPHRRHPCPSPASLSIVPAWAQRLGLLGLERADRCQRAVLRGIIGEIFGEVGVDYGMGWAARWILRALRGQGGVGDAGRGHATTAPAAAWVGSRHPRCRSTTRRAWAASWSCSTWLPGSCTSRRLGSCISASWARLSAWCGLLGLRRGHRRLLGCVGSELSG